jgi:hypothetical protein
MSRTEPTKRNAAQLLDAAVAAEARGSKNVADKALSLAVKRDEEEHKENPKTASLPRS